MKEQIAIVTDSNSGVTKKQAEQFGISVLPMPFNIGGETFFEGINLTQEEFYEKLAKGADISTSQPSIKDITKLWEQLLERVESILHIPMSSGLSGSYETAMVLSKEYNGRVQVVNNQRVSVTQRQSVLDALYLAEQRLSAVEIKERLEKEKLESSIYIMVDTLKYLKKGGRITPAAAALGTLLKIKPVLQIQGEKLDAFAKARTIKQAKSIMIEAMKQDFATRFQQASSEHKMHLAIAHTNNYEAAMELKEELGRELSGYDIYVDHLSLSVACHIGAGSLAIACSKQLQ